MSNRFKLFRTRITLKEGKIIKTRRHIYIAQYIDYDENRCEECALNPKMFECSKIICQKAERINNRVEIKSFILKKIK